MRFNNARRGAYRLRLPLVGGLLLAAGPLLPSCGGPPDLPDVVLLTLDTVNLARTPFGDPASSEFPVSAAQMPHLVELVGRGQRLVGSHTSVPLTLPAHVSMLSGRVPPSHGVLSNRHPVTPTESRLPLPRLLRNAGWSTAGFVSLGVLNATSGLHRSFDHFDDGLDRDTTHAYRRSPETLDRVEEFLANDAKAQGPQFLWVHLADPHEPYLERSPRPTAALEVGDQRHEVALQLRQSHRLTFQLGSEAREVSITGLRAPESPSSAGIFLSELDCRWQPADRTATLTDADPCEAIALEEATRLSTGEGLAFPLPSPAPSGTLELTVRGAHFRPAKDEMDRAYRSELELLDESIGRLLRAIDARQRPTVWAVVSDHGEGLLEHGVRGHAEMVWEEQLETLFAVAAPGIVPGRRATTGVLHSDLAPTLLDLLAIEVPALHRSVESVDFDGVSLLDCLQSASELEASVAEGSGASGACVPRRSWSAYALRHRSGRLVRSATYAWPLKAVWQRGRRQQVFHLLRHPAEDTLADRDTPEAMRLRAGANEAVGAWDTLISGSFTDPNDDERRRLLERLGYL